MHRTVSIVLAYLNFYVYILFVVVSLLLVYLGLVASRMVVCSRWLVIAGYYYYYYLSNN